MSRDKLAHKWAEPYWAQQSELGTTVQGNIAQDSFRAGWEAISFQIKEIIQKAQMPGEAIVEISMLLKDCPERKG